jgi:hypothetical protein
VIRRRSCEARAAAVAIAFAIAYVGGIAGEREAHAQGAGAAQAPSRRVVEVLVAGGGDGAASLDDTVRELLGRLTLVMESQLVGRIDTDDPSFRSTARPSMLARVGIDLRSRDAAIVTIVDGRTGDITVRRSVRRDGPPAVVREELAHVVQAAIDPMLLAERDRTAAALPSPPPPPPPAPEPAPPPPPPPPVPVASADEPPQRDSASSSPASPSRSPFALDVSTMAGAGSFASGAGAVARAGGGAALVYRRGLRPSIGIAAHYVFPFETGSDIALARVAAASVRGLAAIEVLASSSFALDVAVGGGVDVLRVEPRSSSLPSDRLGPTTGRVDPIATVAVTGHLGIAPGTSLSLMLAADVDFASRRWIVDEDGRHDDAFAPSRVRPLAMLGFTFTPLGDSRFAARELTR